MTKQLTRQEFIEEFGVSPEQMIQEADAYNRSSRFLASNWNELADRYPNEWVAIRDAELIAHNADLDAVLKHLDEAGISRVDTLVQFLDASDVVMILLWR